MGMRDKTMLLQDSSNIVVSKGKRNYCCRKNLYDAMSKPINQQNKETLLNIEKWLDEGGSEFCEASAPRLDDTFQEELQADRCAQDCSYHSACSFSRMKKNRKNAAGIIVTNHNQLISDLKLRSRDRGSLWRRPSLYIIDEAHALLDISRNELAIKVSVHNIRRVLNKAQENKSVREWQADFRQHFKTLSHLTESIKSSIGQTIDSGSLLLRSSVELGDALRESMQEMLGSIRSVNETINIINSSLNDVRIKEIEVLENISKDMDNIEESLKDYISSLNNTVNQAFWSEKDRRGKITLYAAPLDPGEFLAGALWQTHCPIILTSGTMTTNKRFDQIERALKLSAVPGHRRKTPARFDSPYDFKNKVLIYVPNDLPEPKHTEEGEEDVFAPAIAERIYELLTYSQGRALVLFTTYYRMGVVHDYLRESHRNYSILKQGDASPGIVLKRFREDYSSVLLATRSLWEGTDVAGGALSLLVIDKLPFPVRSDPLIEKLAERAKREGKDPMQEVILPMMLTDLSQGSGRLIRQEGDSGIIALLDRRAWTPKYRSLVEDHLPPSPWTSNIADVRDWFSKDTRTV